MYSLPNLNPLRDGVNICKRLYVGFCSKLLRRKRTAMADEVIHDQVVEVPISRRLVRHIAVQRLMGLPESRGFDATSANKLTYFPHGSSERFPI